MIEYVITRFIDAKMARADISTALYRISTEMGGPTLVMRMQERSLNALEGMVYSAPELAQTPDRFAIQMMYAAMAGAKRTVLEAGAAPALVATFREHLILLCRTYMSAAATHTGKV